MSIKYSDTKNMINIENLNGQSADVEIIGQVNSKRDDKKYVILAIDKNIDEQVAVLIGNIYEKDNQLTMDLVNDNEEIDYVTSLINESIKGV